MRRRHFGRLSRSWIMTLVWIARLVRRRDLRIRVGDFDLLRSSSVAIAIDISVSNSLRTTAQVFLRRGPAAHVPAAVARAWAGGAGGSVTRSRAAPGI